MHGMYRLARIGGAGLIGVLLSLLVVPLFLHAQPTVEDDTRLRTEIRLALLSDARTSNLNEQELEGLVAALAEEAEEQGLVAEYIPPEPTFATWYGEAAGYAFFGVSVSEAALYIIILIALGLAIVLLRRIFTMHHEVPLNPSVPDTSQQASSQVPPAPPSPPTPPAPPSPSA